MKTRKLDTPYTKEEIEATQVSESLRAAISKVVSTYVVEFQGVTQEWANENTPKFLPVIFALIEDGMLTGQYIAEQKIARMLYDNQALNALSKMTMSASNIQN